MLDVQVVRLPYPDMVAYLSLALLLSVDLETFDPFLVAVDDQHLDGEPEVRPLEVLNLPRSAVVPLEEDLSQ